jgi:hypothetical protein
MGIAYPPKNSDLCDRLKPDLVKAEGQTKTRKARKIETIVPKKLKAKGLIK